VRDGELGQLGLRSLAEIDARYAEFMTKGGRRVVHLWIESALAQLKMLNPVAPMDGLT
jgi:hypothetical protein